MLLIYSQILLSSLQVFSFLSPSLSSDRCHSCCWLVSKDDSGTWVTTTLAPLKAPCLLPSSGGRVSDAAPRGEAEKPRGSADPTWRGSQARCAPVGGGRRWSELGQVVGPSVVVAPVRARLTQVRSRAGNQPRRLTAATGRVAFFAFLNPCHNNTSAPEGIAEVACSVLVSCHVAVIVGAGVQEWWLGHFFNPGSGILIRDLQPASMSVIMKGHKRQVGDACTDSRLLGLMELLLDAAVWPRPLCASTTTVSANNLRYICIRDQLWPSPRL